MALHCASSITDVALRHFTSDLFTNLQRFYLSWNENISDAGVLAFVKARGSRLTALGLSGCSQLTSEALWSVAQQCPRYWAEQRQRCAPRHKQMRRLKEVDISYSSFSSRSLTTLAELCPEVRTWNLSFSSCATYEAVQFILFHCQHLERLNIFECVNVSDAEAALLSQEVRAEYPRCAVVA